MSANTDHRLAQLQAQVAPTEAFFITTPSDVEYLTGFECLVPEEREAFLMVTAKTTYLLHASFSPTPPSSILKKMSGTHLEALKLHLNQILADESLTKIWVDKTRLFADEYEVLQQATKVELATFDRKLLWKLRMIKDETEIAAAREAGRIASQAFEKLSSTIKVGQTEKEIQHRLDAYMSELGSEKPAFPTIVAFGPHGALPHHQPTDTRLEAETAILIDFGATFHHYRSDITRSWWFGKKPPAEFTKIKNLVDEAYQQALEFLAQTTEPRTAQAVDAVCRVFLSEAGYGDKFIHTTGHGVGLDIHEPPSLYWKNEVPLQPGMIITIEPGIYIQDAFGYRWENTVLVTENNGKIITDSK